MRAILMLAAFLVLALVPDGPAAAEWWDPMMKSAGPQRSSTAQGRRSQNRAAAKSQRATRTATRTARADRPARSYGGGGGGGGQSGIASYYWQPQRTASGGWFNPNAMTAAHKTLPLGTRVRVTRNDTGQSVDVTINDRGPYVGGRVIDLSRAAAQSINMTGRGLAPVSVSVLGR